MIPRRPTRRIPGSLGPGLAALLTLCPGTPGSAQQFGPPAPPDTLTVLWAVDGALSRHPSVGAGRAGVDRATAQVGVARSAWWPTLSIAGSYTRFELPMLVRPLHELDPEGIEFDSQPVTGRLSVDWLVFDGGERRARVRASSAAADGARATLASREMDLIERTVAAFLQIRTLREIRSAQDAKVRALEAERDRVLLLLDAGRAAQVELLRAEAALSQALAEAASLQARLRAGEAQLARLVGVDAGVVQARPLAPVRPTNDAGAGPTVSGQVGDVPATPAGPTPPASLHPELQTSWSRVLQAQAGRDQARATWLPDLSLSGGARQYAAPSRDLTNEWQIGLSLSYPLFTGFRRSSQVAAANAQVEAALEEHRLEELELAQELDEARVAVVEADARVRALSRAVEQFTEVARIEALALEAGAGVQRDFLDAQAALFQSRAGLARARNARVLAHVREAAARGVLTWAWLEATTESRP